VARSTSSPSSSQQTHERLSISARQHLFRVQFLQRVSLQYLLRPDEWCETFSFPLLSGQPSSLGDVNFLDQAAATAAGLSFVNGDGNVVLKVDDTSFVPNGQKRNSVRLSSKDSFGLGTVWVLDAYHVPFGCRYVLRKCR
jgi:hypothetical protein